MLHGHCRCCAETQESTRNAEGESTLDAGIELTRSEGYGSGTMGPLNDERASSAGRERQRCHLLREILSTEQKYNKTLATLKKAQPLS